MLSKRTLKHRNISRHFYRVMILPIHDKRLKAKSDYLAMEQTVLSSKHLDDDGAIYRASLALKNSYAETYIRLHRLQVRRIIKHRHDGW